MTTARDFLDLTLPHMDAVFAIARRMSANKEEAEDLVQETYLHAFQAFGGYRGGDMRSWLASICLNASRSRGRRRQRRPAEQLDADAGASMAAADDVAREAVGALERAAIARALSRLPEGQRTSIVLVDLAGLTAQQAADLLNCPRGTVLARIHRGRKLLARHLAVEGVTREP